MKQIKSMTVEEIKGKLVREELPIASLDLTKTPQKNALLAAVKERNALLKRIEGPKAEATLQMILENAKDNYKYFVQLNRSQYTDKLLQIYLYNRFNEDALRNTDPGKDAYQFYVQKSLDDKTTFTYSYVSGEADLLNYMDKDVGIPLSLKSSIKITLKIADSLALLDKLDTHITHLGAQRIKGKLFDMITSQYKAFLGAYLHDKGLGFYSLSSALSDAQESIKQSFAGIFAPFGMEISDFVIRKIAIPKDIQTKVEDLAFAIRQSHAEMEADAKLAKISLQCYEDKLAVQQKYPDAEPSLTEYEKDLALNRYLTKIGRSKEDGPDRSIKLQQSSDRTDKVIEKQHDVRPEAPKTVNKFKITYICLLIVSLMAAVIIGTGTESVGVALMILGGIFLIFGPVAAFNLQKFKAPVETEAADSESGGNE